MKMGASVKELIEKQKRRARVRCARDIAEPDLLTVKPTRKPSTVIGRLEPGATVQVGESVDLVKQLDGVSIQRGGMRLGTAPKLSRQVESLFDRFNGTLRGEVDRIHHYGVGFDVKVNKSDTQSR
jgi:hypothetical protein